MQRIVKRAIKVTGVGTPEHHRQIFAVHPVGFFPQPFTNTFVKFRSGQRVRHGHTDIVRLGFADQLNGLLDFAPGFTWISELNEEARADSVLSQSGHRPGNLADVRTFLHGIQNPLRSGFHTHPDFDATGPAQ